MPDQSNCIYGAGSRLERSIINLNEMRNRYQGGQEKLVTKGISFYYNEEGNLAKKIEPNGGTWSYIYYGNGMLKEVTKPDQSNVRCIERDAIIKFFLKREKRYRKYLWLCKNKQE